MGRHAALGYGPSTAVGSHACPWTLLPNQGAEGQQTLAKAPGSDAFLFHPRWTWSPCLAGPWSTNGTQLLHPHTYTAGKNPSSLRRWEVWDLPQEEMGKKHRILPQPLALKEESGRTFLS